MGQEHGYKFVVKAGPNPGEVFTLKRNVTIIGRDPTGSDWWIDFTAVSQRHAGVTKAGGAFQIEDLKSSNGTFVNGQKITAPRILKPGDEVALGKSVVLTFVSDESDVSESVSQSASATFIDSAYPEYDSRTPVEAPEHATQVIREKAPQTPEHDNRKSLGETLVGSLKESGIFIRPESIIDKPNEQYSVSLMISYSRKDKEFIQKLHDGLIKLGIAAENIWVDWEGIPLSADWREEITRGIQKSDVFLFVISPDSLSSQVCAEEVEIAVKNNKRIVAVLHREPEKGNPMPNEIGSTNWVYLRASDDFNKVIPQLVETLNTDLGWIRQHTRILERAIEWDKSKRSNAYLLRGEDLEASEQWLTGAANQAQQPTSLQIEYIRSSRKAAKRQRRITTGISIFAMFALAALAAFGFYQASVAGTERDNALAQTQKALARQLSAQAQTIIASRNSNQMIAVLLATQSMKIDPSSEAAQVLLNNNTAAHTIASMKHDGWVDSVAFSPNGEYVVSSGTDETIVRVWVAATGEEIARFMHESGVMDATFSPDGRYVASGSFDNTARIWEISTGQEIARMTLDLDYGPNSVAFSPDGKLLVTGSQDMTARVWDVSTGWEVARMTHDEFVGNVAFSPDGYYVVSGDDNTVRVWEASTGVEISRINQYLSSVSFSPDGNYIVSGGWFGDNSVHVWEVATGAEVFRTIHNSAVSSVAFSPDGQFVASGSEDGTARVWNISAGQEVSRMTHDSGVTAVVFSPDGQYVVSGSNDNTARMWSAATGKEVARMTHDDYVTSVAFSSNGIYIVSGSRDGTAQIWEIAPGKEVFVNPYLYALAYSSDDQYVVTILDDYNTACVYETSTGRQISCMAHDDWVISAVFSPDDKYVVTGGANSDHTARMWEVATGKEVVRVTADWEVYHVAFSPNGKYIVTGSNPTAVVWDAVTGREVSRVSLEDGISSIAFSSDSKYVATGTRNLAIVWEADTGNEISRLIFDNDDSAVFAITFSPDGIYVATGSSDTTARVWEIATGNEVARMTHDDDVSVIAFSSVGRYVVSGSDDKTVRMWEASTGEEVVRIILDEAPQSVGFSLDENYILVDGREWIWQVGDLIENACPYLPRNLTRSEWKKYIGDTLPYQAVCENLPIESEEAQ